MLCVATATLFAIVILPAEGMAQSKESRFDVGEEESEQRFLLEIRDDTEYSKSAFSFRTEAQDIDVHRNNVDLVFNNCGRLHFNPVLGMKSKVADLGEEDLRVEVDLEEEDRDWSASSFIPEEGHVYLQVVNYQGGAMKVKFRIDEMERDEKLAISFEVLEEWSGGRPSSAKAGVMGKCGGPHPPK